MALAVSGRVAIKDYEPGIDRLDLSRLGMIRSTLQLRFQPTAGGIRIWFGNTVIDIASNGGCTLLPQMFGDGMFPVVHYQPPDVRTTLTGTARPDALTAACGGSTVWGCACADRILGSGLEDHLIGGIGHDRMIGGDGDDTIWADAINDFVRGDGGNDRVIGGLGHDVILGGDGADTLAGGERCPSGRDRRRSAAGRGGRRCLSVDRRGIVPGDRPDTIPGFIAGEDRLDLSALILTCIAETAFSGHAGQLRWTVEATGITVQADLDGDALADLVLWLDSLAALSRGDLIL